MAAYEINPETLNPAQRVLFGRVSERYKPEGGNPQLWESVRRWAAGEHLTYDEAREAFGSLLADDATPYQMGIFLMLGSPEFLTADELAGFASALRAKAEPVTILSPTGEPEPMLLDTCGTGGDTIPTFNISTTLMFILAAEGIRVAKHGNRAITSKSGSSDVLQALGINVNLGSDAVKRCIEECGAGFMFAPLFHKAMKKVAEIRGVLGEPLPDGTKFKTMFNVLGPLSNPARTPLQSLGVYGANILRKQAEALSRLGHIRRAFVMHGFGPKDDPSLGGRGLDEVSTIGETSLIELGPGGLHEFIITPEDSLGMKRALASEITGGDAAGNAEIIRGILDGSVQGPRRDIVIANAAVALALATEGEGFIAHHPTALRERVAQAAESLASGRANRKYEELRELSNRLAS